MKDEPTLRQRIRGIVAEELQIDPPGDDVNLIEGGLIDSMLFVALLTRLEREFDRAIPLETLDLEAFSSIARISRLIATN